jgi:hypothetical protein
LKLNFLIKELLQKIILRFIDFNFEIYYDII